MSEIRYGDWAETATKAINNVPGVTKESSSGDKYKYFRAEEQNRKLKGLIAETRRKQAEAYRLPEIMEADYPVDIPAELIEKIDSEKAGKSSSTHADPWHLADDADFYGIDEEGADLLLRSPNKKTCYWQESDICSLRLPERRHDISRNGTRKFRYDQYITDHIDPRLKESDPERYIHKTAYILPPVCTPEKLAEARREQFRRDEKDAAAAIDALLAAHR